MISDLVGDFTHAWGILSQNWRGISHIPLYSNFTAHNHGAEGDLDQDAGHVLCA